LCFVGEKAKWFSFCGKQFVSSSKVKHEVLSDPEIPPIDLYSSIQNRYSKNTCISILLEALITIAKR
jgi:hypothetical protein